MVDPDEELIKRAQAGDKHAFDTLYRKHQQRVVQYCRRLLNNLSDHEDVSQEIFAMAWQKIDSFRGAAHFEHWLMRIATNTCHNRRRGYKAEISLEEILETIGAEPGACDPAIERTEEQIHTEYLLERVSYHVRRADPPWTPVVWNIFLLFYHDLLNAAEIGRKLGLKSGTVRALKSTHIRPVIEKVIQERKDAGKESV
ncbi:MAG: polymerase subunit sigma [Chthonomonadaceae bacterium]|nr:polymerase subunit sigma [Chthonomonadaceae bacterium]